MADFDALGLMDQFAQLAEQYEGFRQQLVKFGWPDDEAARMVRLVVEQALWSERQKSGAS